MSTAGARDGRARASLRPGRAGAEQRLDATFAALAEPTRRRVVGLLLEQPRRAGEIADLLRMGAPALSRHLRVLRRSGLVAEQGVTHDARVRIYSLRPEALAPLRHWLAEVEELWSEQLLAFKEHAERSRRPPRGGRG